MHHPASASCTFLPLVPCSNQGRWAASGQPTYPPNPMGCKRSLSKEPYRNNTVMRYLTQTLDTSVKRGLARPLHAGPVTYSTVMSRYYSSTWLQLVLHFLSLEMMQDSA